MPVRPTSTYMTAEQFLIACPEFAQTDLSLIQNTLDEAALECDVNTFGPQLATAHKYLTAHKLAQSPQGNGTRLIPNQGETTYMKEYRRLLQSNAMGFRVSGNTADPYPWSD